MLKSRPEGIQLFPSNVTTSQSKALEYLYGYKTTDTQLAKLNIWLTVKMIRHAKKMTLTEVKKNKITQN